VVSFLSVYFSNRRIWFNVTKDIILTLWTSFFYSYAIPLRLVDFCAVIEYRSVGLICFRECNFSGWKRATVFVTNVTYLTWRTVSYHSKIMWYLAVATGLQDAIPDLLWWMSLLFGAQFTKSRCHWRSGNSWLLFCYKPRSIYSFRDSKSRKSSFSQVCRQKKKKRSKIFIDSCDKLG